MKIIARVLVVIVAIPTFILCILSINIRFQFLSPDFWLASFEKANVYSQISDSLNNRLVSKVVASGGKGSDVSVLSSLISENVIKKLFEENIANMLLYANGKTPIMQVSMPFPTRDLPVGFDVQNLDNFTEKIPLSDFLKEFDIKVVTESDIKMVAEFGFWSWMFMVASFSLLVLVLTLTYIFNDAGRHLITSGMALTLSGLTALGVFFAGNFASKAMMENYQASNNIGISFAAIVISPVVQKALQIWIWFGVVALILGIILFFVKKPVINKTR